MVQISPSSPPIQSQKEGLPPKTLKTNEPLQSIHLSLYSTLTRQEYTDNSEIDHFTKLLLS